MTSGYAISA